MITVCIVNYNGYKYLQSCFDSIRRTKYQTDKVETIMVDNASSDKSVDYVKTNFPWVKVLELDRNYGFAKGNNIGVKSAKGEYVVFLNNDTVVNPDWLNKLVEVMEKDRNIGIAGGKILFFEESRKINSAGGNITFIGGGYDRGFLDYDSEQYNIRESRGFICAAFMIVRKDEFLNSGGFDEDYFIYAEDTDLCWRYWLNGSRVEFVPDAVIYHRLGGTSGVNRYAPQRVFYGTRNALFNILKNYEIQNIFIALMFSFFYHVLKIFYFIIRLDFGLVFKMIKAQGSFIKNLPKVVGKRKMIQRNRTVRDSRLFLDSVIESPYQTLREFLRLLKI